MNTANRNYKDSVFVDLFSTDEKAKERFLSLYNALHGTELPLHCPVEQLKLDNIMYRGLINDVSCLVDNKIIVLAEHCKKFRHLNFMSFTTGRETIRSTLRSNFLTHL